MNLCRPINVIELKKKEIDYHAQSWGYDDLE